ncbi:hypothetical protein QUF72_21035 [Desulfobacterales bacterium HSG2]|nr:hypothetical protein [Desulfobacterales bacterium HSG2]
MMSKNVFKSDKVFKGIIIFAVIVTVTAGGLWFWWKQKPAEPVVETPPEKEAMPSVAKDAPEKADASPEPRYVIDYGKLDKDPEFRDSMQKRKDEYGVDKGIDMVVKSDESIKIAGSTIPMQEILDKIQLKEGDLVEKDLTGKSAISGTAGSREKAAPEVSGGITEADLKGGHDEIKTPQKDTPEEDFEMSVVHDEATGVYGIYVVHPGDNIWNIHFAFLKDYFSKKGVRLSSRADEPMSGRSSGVGKLLKFSEKMVYIYNIRERKLDIDLDQIHPLSKVVVFNLGRAFSLLRQIDYKNVNRIQFDGDTLWIPAEQ